ncbi:TRAP transporter small permease [Falsirhodobacter halotolerans]|uniref:TRAP transporter small permease n=1 Tax=Falsirhodobacter halotolerans TaxID=1146892 RepID=UPI001FD0CFAE|nr:TRAP transporter small permease subunit [Falsirhodobacter halotolerans]MCJ8141022.1 TRAP transporter small permease subunit [Falsirhodobacter halotolerans]
MRRAQDWIAAAAEVVASLCFGLFLLAILAQVAYRYLGVNLIFSEELARLLNVYVVFVGVIVVTRSDGHIRIDLVERALAHRPALCRAMTIVQRALSLAFLLLVAWGAWHLMQGGWSSRLSTMQYLSQGHIYLAPCLGASLSALLMALRLIEECAGIAALRGAAS